MGTQADQLPIPGDAQPEMDELQGREREGVLFPIPVRVEGPVRTQPLPARDGAIRDVTCTSTESVRLAKKDLTRARAVIRSRVGAFYLGFTKSDADAGVGYCPQTVTPLELFVVNEIWVRAVNVDASITIITENWTH